MKEVRKLYEERNMASLIKICHEQIEEGTADFDTYACMAYAQAARNNLSRLFLEEGMQMFEKAASLCEGTPELCKELYENFTKEVCGGMKRADEAFAEVAVTSDTVQAYRDCMRLGAEALMAAAAFADAAGDISSLEEKKQAVSYMVKLCAVYQFEQDLGKVKVKKVGNAPDDIRETYNKKYDALIAEIQAADAAYVPEEIQRERIDAEHPEKKPEETSDDGKPKKKGLIDRILDFF